MTKQKLFLLIQSLLCILIAALLVLTAVRLYLDGSALQAAGQTSEQIYTREKIIHSLIPILPLFLFSLVMTVFGLIRGIRDENAEKPVRSIEPFDWEMSGNIPEIGKPLRGHEAAPGSFKLWLLMMLAAAGFIILGIYNGSFSDVFHKAIMICTECVGLG